MDEFRAGDARLPALWLVAMRPGGDVVGTCCKREVCVPPDTGELVLVTRAEILEHAEAEGRRAVLGAAGAVARAPDPRAAAVRR